MAKSALLIFGSIIKSSDLQQEHEWLESFFSSLFHTLLVSDD